MAVEQSNIEACVWGGGDGEANHQHYAVLVREAVGGKLMGRLTPDGTATNRNIYAAVYSKNIAEEISEKINGVAVNTPTPFYFKSST